MVSVESMGMLRRLWKCSVRLLYRLWTACDFCTISGQRGNVVASMEMQNGTVVASMEVQRGTVVASMEVQHGTVVASMEVQRMTVVASIEVLISFFESCTAVKS